MKDGRNERSSTKGDGGQAAISLTPGIGGPGSGSLLDSILYTLLKKWSSDVWVVALFFSSQMTQYHWIAFWITAATSVYLSKIRSCFSKPNSASSDKENPLALSASWMSSVCQLLLSLVSLRPSWCLALLSSSSYNHHCFYGYFWTSWAWNKDAVLLFSIQYCPVKYTKALPFIDDAHTWQHATETWTNLCDWTCEDMFASLKVLNSKVHM